MSCILVIRQQTSSLPEISRLSHRFHSSHAIDLLIKSDKPAPPEVMESLLSTMRRLLRWFVSRSDPLSAAKCLSLLQKVYSFMGQSKFVIDSASDFLSVSAKFEDLVTILSNNIDPPIFVDSGSDGLQTDSVMRCLTITFQQLCGSSFGSTSAELQTLLCQSSARCDAKIETTSHSTDNIEDPDFNLVSEPNMMLQKRLATTLMLMLHAKLCIDAGQPTTAVKYLEWCRVQCRDLVNFLRSLRCHLNNLILDDIAIQVDDLLTTCYERLAAAFCLLGIRRKTEDYALLAVMRLKVLSAKTFGQIHIQDLIDSLDQYDGYECFLHHIRSLMKAKSLSTPPEKFSSRQVLIEKMRWMKDLDSDDAFQVNRILSKPKNLLTCE